MLNFITKLFDSNDKEVNKLLPIVAEINSFEKKIQKLKDTDFPKKTEELKKRIAGGENLYLVLPEAFALVREAAQRTVGLRHYDVQMIAATVLAQGKVAEQKTGEGKTLSATPALYLHALTGKPVHLVTVNDYLARRDAGWMGDIFTFLGLRVGAIINDASYIFDKVYEDNTVNDYRLTHLKPVSRKEAYQADVVYGINSEFGFDYLRDNMATSIDQLVQREHYYAIIDEVDSVLIDEARTPHIISMPDATPSNKYYEYSKLIDKLQPIDYKLDEKRRTAHLTDHGIGKIESMFGVKDIYEKDFDTVYHIEAALKAKLLYQKNKDYIVRDNQVILVDEFTGRLLEGRRLSEGLHQAIEAKEEVTIQQESKTLATVSLQNYFRKYDLLAGMTGTAATEAEEFHKIYKLDVIVIPSNRLIQREDISDQIYKTQRAKITAVVNEIEEAHRRGQPVLVGTASIGHNEIVSETLKRRKIPHEVLNAKNHLREALIIKDAGKKGAVTVATNMAGRGVDIILGGQPPSEFETQYQSKTGKKQFEKEYASWKKEHEDVLSVGGLYVIGTEKHESRRIDNQLRGRSGRQGDPGKSVFIISLEDDLMRIFGGDQIAGLMTRFNFPEDQPLTHALVTRVITQAQVKVEGFNFESRKYTVEYDDVLNKQREIVYEMRHDLLEGNDHEEFIIERLGNAIDASVEMQYVMQGEDIDKAILTDFVNIIPLDPHSQKHILEQLESRQDKEEKKEFLKTLSSDIFKRRENELGKDIANQLIKAVSLQVIDNLWMNHLTSMEDLRIGIRLQAFSQKDPLVEYKNQAFKLFEKLIGGIDDGIVTRIFKVQIVTEQPTINTSSISTNQPAEEVGTEAVQEKKTTSKKVTQNDAGEKKKLGRNDPCWCGSGKKYKKCHYPN
ncbi:MAG: preprotein translocase subunit SecA [Candidatus Levybacteria bacterium]|nr:preprotein translocase subunit SecA [Candidatus Levybacteria bacterium]